MSTYKVKLNGKELKVNLLEKDGTRLKFEVSKNTYEVELESILSEAQHGLQANDGAASFQSGRKAINSPMPGLIVKIPVKEKQSVKANQLLMTIEAMKMENNIFAPADGKIKKIHVKQGQEVKNQEVLITME